MSNDNTGLAVPDISGLNPQIQSIVPTTPSFVSPTVGTFATRQEQARLACEAAGIVWPGTILPEGTALYSSGVEKLKNDRAAWQRLPFARDVVGLVAAALAAEDRRDYAVNVEDIYLDEFTGRIKRLTSDNKPGLGYGDHSFRQLVAQIGTFDSAPKGFASALLYLTDKERAEIVNKRMIQLRQRVHAFQADPNADKAHDPQTIVTMRTKLPHVGSSRIARAVLSERYGSVTDHDLAGAIGAALNNDAHARLDYKPGDSKSRFEVIFASEIPVETFVVGDVHYAGVAVNNSETGQGGVNIIPFVVRARCANLTLSVGEGLNENIRHIGDSDRLMQKVNRAIQAAVAEIEPLLATIGLSARVSLGSWSAEDALTKIAKKFDMGKAAPAAWMAQLKESNYPQDSVWGMAAAISEAAHRRETWADEAEWEKVASTVQARVAQVIGKGTPHELALEKALSLN